MPYDSNGNFSLVPGTIVADGMNVQPSQHNPPFQDVANGLSQAVVRDGRAPMTGPLNMNGNKITGVASGSQPTDVVTFADISDLGVAIGDGKWSVRDLSPNWLRRDGKLYSRADYPELANLMPALPDGVVWEGRSSGAESIVVDVIHDGDRFVAVTLLGAVVASQNGVDWSVIGNIGNSSVKSIAYGNGFYIAVRSVGGDVYISPNAEIWERAGVTLGAALWHVRFGDGVFVIVGGDGEITTTEDGSSFTTRTSGTTQSLRGAHYTGAEWIVVGNGGTILTSIDATTWTARSSGITTALYGVGSYNGMYIVTGSLGVILSSTNLSGWTPRTSGTNLQISAVVGNDVGFLVVGNGGYARISENGTTWASAPTGYSSNLTSVVIDPDDERRYLVGGPTGTIMEGLRTMPTQFRVPNDDPTYGWIRAL